MKSLFLVLTLCLMAQSAFATCDEAEAQAKLHPFISAIIKANYPTVTKYTSTPNGLAVNYNKNGQFERLITDFEFVENERIYRFKMVISSDCKPYPYPNGSLVPFQLFEYDVK